MSTPAAAKGKQMLAGAYAAPSAPPIAPPSGPPSAPSGRKPVPPGEGETHLKLSKRIIFASGGTGGDVVLHRNEKGEMVRGKKAISALESTKSRIGSHGDFLKEVGGSPKMDSTIFNWWDRVLYQRERGSDRRGKVLADSVQRVIRKVVHNQNHEPYSPPEKEKGARAAPFNLMNVEEMKLVCLTAVHLMLKMDPTLVPVRSPAKVFGDIHGQIKDLCLFFRQYGAPSHRIGDVNMCTYVFSGDFVDRGAYSLEVLMTLLCLKIRYHPHVVLLRGNHESEYCNQYYGFMEELVNRLGSQAGADLYRSAILPVFQALPLAALIEDRIFVTHGGPGLNVETLDDVRSIPRPIKWPTNMMSQSNPVQNKVIDLLWSDPVDCRGLTKADLMFNRGLNQWTGRAFNSNRGVATFYGPDVVERFCRRNGVEVIVRAHECVDDGMLVACGGKLITLFSAPCYGGDTNSGSILEISRDLYMQFKAIEAAHADPTWSNLDNLDRPRRSMSVSGNATS